MQRLLNIVSRRLGIYRSILRVAWPLIVTTGSFTLMMFCDRMFLAWHSAEAIQAALPAGILSFTMVCGFMALASYANTFVAQYFGSGDLQGCSRATAQGVWFSLLSYPILLLLIPVGQYLIRASGHVPGVMEKELVYYRILMIGSIATPLGAAMSSFFSGRGDTRTTMYVNLVGNGVNIVLDYGLIFGRWGLPEMGIRGAALATVIAGFITPIMLGWLFWTRYNDKQWQTHANFRYDRDLFRRMIRFGFPSGVHLFLDIASFSFFVLLTGRLGAEALSASNIALSVNTLAFMPLIGLGIAASILVGQHQGRRESEQAQRAGWAAFQMGLIYMVIIGAVFVFCPRTLFGLFAGRGESSVVLDDVLPTGRILLIIAAVWGLADAGNLILGSGLKGAGDTRFVMYYSVVLAWAMFAAGQYVIVEVLQRGIIASWLWTALYVFALSAGYFWRFASGRWKKIDVLGREDPASSPSDLKGSGNC